MYIRNNLLNFKYSCVTHARVAFFFFTQSAFIDLTRSDLVPQILPCRTGFFRELVRGRSRPRIRQKNPVLGSYMEVNLPDQIF